MKTPDRALQLVKQQNVSSVQQLRSNNLSSADKPSLLNQQQRAEQGSAPLPNVELQHTLVSETATDRPGDAPVLDRQTSLCVPLAH